MKSKNFFFAGGKSVQDLKAFVMEKIPQMKSLKQSVTTHTSIAELVKEKIDNPASLEFLQVEQELVNNQKVMISREKKYSDFSKF